VILVVNIGSSSLKLALFFLNGVKINFLYKENIVLKSLKDITQIVSSRIEFYYSKQFVQQIDVVIHRVVHGGKFVRPVLLNKTIINGIKKNSSFAPLHNPYNIAGIEVCRKLFPFIKQYAVFDTAFHASLPLKVKIYGLPYSYYEQGIMKYGFHGQNFAYCTKIAIQFLYQEKNKLIICHLGNGCSITAVKDGKSVDTSMGFTPAEGLLMGTRAGDIDSGVIEYLLRKNSVENVFSVLEKKSGLVGISGESNDVLQLHKISLGKGERAKRAQLAIDVFVYRIVRYIGAYYAVLGGCDAIVFTGGIGENAWYLREEICKQLKVFGLQFDLNENRKNAFLISVKKSKIKVLVIAANEELQMVKEVFE